MWLATGSLLTVWWRMQVSGAETAPCLQALAVACLPLCLLQGEGPVHSGLALLWYSLSPLFCESFGESCLSLSLSLSLSLFFFFPFPAVPQFGLLSDLSSLRLSSGHWLPVPKHTAWSLP